MGLYQLIVCEFFVAINYNTYHNCVYTMTAILQWYFYHILDIKVFDVNEIYRILIYM